MCESNVYLLDRLVLLNLSDGGDGGGRLQKVLPVVVAADRRLLIVVDCC